MWSAGASRQELVPMWWLVLAGSAGAGAGSGRRLERKRPVGDMAAGGRLW